MEPDMTKIIPLLVSSPLLFLSAEPVVAADTTHPAKDASPAVTDDSGSRQNPQSVRPRRRSMARPIASRTIRR